MGINPKDFEVSEDSIRQRLQLSKDIIIVPFGYEKILDDAIVMTLKTRYDLGSLFVRTQPDFFVIDSNELYFVEAKKRIKNVEAIQLFYNKQYEKMGVKVVYSFPELVIRASMIPMKTVIVPENYQEKFDVNLKYLFENEGVTEFRYVKHVDASGDAFVPIELDDLKLLGDK